MKTILNYTPHPVHLIINEDNIITFISVGNARCNQITSGAGFLKNDCGAIPLTETQFGEIIDLPEPKENTYYIVSRIVRSAAVGRNDLLVPNDIVRDGSNNIIGCKSFAIN